MRTSTIIILFIVAFVTFSRADTARCEFSLGEMICEIEPDPFEQMEREDFREEIRAHQQEMEYQAERAATEMEIWALEHEGDNYE